MEENVALDSSKQKRFVKSIKGIKKLIKKNDTVPVPDNIAKVKASDGKVHKRKRKQRGLVYLSHIPHGFYEHEMTQYFKQFGVVTNSRVIRSKRTGNSKGHAFVEFKETSVAEIVAETMNNYLMGKRLIKAAYIPPEKQRPNAMRKHWSPNNNPGNDLRIKQKKAYNANKDEEGDLKKAEKMLSNFCRTKKKLSELGINYDFFTPVDVPEVLLGKLTEPIEEEMNGKENYVTIKTEDTKSNEKKVPQEMEGGKKKGKGKKKNVEQSTEVEKIKTDKPSKEKKNNNKKEGIIANDNVKAQTKQEQKQKMNGKNVKPLEDFIRTQEDSNDSDSSYAFDSDEYENTIENDDEFDSNMSSEGGNDESKEVDSDISDDDNGSDAESVEDVPAPKKKGNAPKKLHLMQMMKNATKQEVQKKFPQQPKRKSPQEATKAAKKPKFEKQGKQKPTNKQFKKRK